MYAGDNMKLNLGCGGDIREGYENIDLYHKDPRVKNVDIERLNEIYSANSIDEIVASDVIEHISHRHVKKVLQMWISILKPGGKIYIKTPDVVKQLECFTNGTWNVELFSYMVFGGQETPGNFHKCTFTIDYLSKLLESYGIIIKTINIEHFRLTSDRATSANANMIITGEKK